MFAYLSMVGGVYKKLYLNMIEVSFILNLGILLSTSLYAIGTDSSVLPIAIASVAIAFVMFVCILLVMLLRKYFTHERANCYFL